MKSQISLDRVSDNQANVRSSNGRSNATIHNGDLSINLDTETVMLEKQHIHFTNREYTILKLLALRNGSTVTKDVIKSHLYGGMDEGQIMNVGVFVFNLRKKLSYASRVNYIETVWARGYMMPNFEKDELQA